MDTLNRAKDGVQVQLGAFTRASLVICADATASLSADRLREPGPLER